MKNLNLKGFNSVKADEELIERTSQKIMNSHGNKSTPFLKKTMLVATCILVLCGSYLFFKSNVLTKIDEAAPSKKVPLVQENDFVQLPAIELPENSNSAADMIGLIVYDGKIYTQSGTMIDPDNAQSLFGEKLGITKGNIDEWSKQDEYVEFASTIGVADVYTVKGYDPEFRIMAYSEENGYVRAGFYECLNGITISSGKDIFGKLNIDGNIISAQFRTFSDWDQSIDRYYPIDSELVDAFVKELNRTVPYSYENAEEILGDYRNDEEYKELSIHLRDGSKVTVVLIEGGFIRYGFSNVYFKMDSQDFESLWDRLKA